jgi:tRNA splicing ligase
MVIEQTVEVPANHRLTIDVPHEIPAGPAILAFRPTTVQRTDKVKQNHKTPIIDRLAGIDEVRQLLQKEMAQKGTTAVSAVSGDGWEAHILERYAES